MDVIETDALGRRWLVSRGLAARGQGEIAIPLGSAASCERRTAETVLRMVNDYTGSQGRRIVAGETMVYNIDHLRFRAASEAERAELSVALVGQEASDPLVDTAEYVDGVVALSRIDDEMRAVLQRHEEQSGKFAYRGLSAVVCKQFGTSPGRLHLWRDLPRDEHDSGWHFRCADLQHDHDNAESFVIEHLGCAIQLRPVILPYLFLPYGSQLAIDLEYSSAAVFRPGHSQAVIARLIGR